MPTRWFQSRKLNRRSCLVLAAALFAIGLFVPLHGVHAGLLSSFFSLGGATLFVILATVLWIPIYFLGVSIGWLITILVMVARYNNFGGEWGVELGWVVVRDISNMFFIVVLLVIAVATIFKVESYSYRQLLPKLVIMAILINFSKSITLFFIDISQIVMLTFVNAFKDIVAGNILQATGVGNILGMDIGKTINTLTGDAAGYNILGSLLLGVSLLAVTTGVLLVFIVVFVARIVMLWILVILSPLAYILSVLPGAQRYASQWWEKFIPNLITGPVLAFFLWLSLTILNQNIFVGSFGNDAELGGAAFAANPFVSQAGSVASMFNFIITVALLMGSLMIAQQIGGAAASFAGTVSGKLNQWGTNVAKTGLLPAKGVAEAAKFGVDKLHETTGVDLNLPRFWKTFKETKEHKRNERYLMGTLTAANAVKTMKGPFRRMRTLALMTGMPKYTADELTTFKGLKRLALGRVGVKADEKVKKGMDAYIKAERQQLSARMLLKGLGAEQKDDRKMLTQKAKDEYDESDKARKSIDAEAAKLAKQAKTDARPEEKEKARDRIRELSKEYGLDEEKFLEGDTIKADEFVTALREKTGTGVDAVTAKKNRWKALEKGYDIMEKTSTKEGPLTAAEADEARNVEALFLDAARHHGTAGKRWELERLQKYSKQVQDAEDAGANEQQIEAILDEARKEGIQVKTKKDLVDGRDKLDQELRKEDTETEAKIREVRDLDDAQVKEQLSWQGLGAVALQKEKTEKEKEMSEMKREWDNKNKKYIFKGLNKSDQEGRDDRLYEIAKILKSIDKDINNISADTSKTPEEKAKEIAKSEKLRKKYIDEATVKGGVLDAATGNKFLKEERRDGKDRVVRDMDKFVTATEEELASEKRREEYEEKYDKHEESVFVMQQRLDPKNRTLSEARKDELRSDIERLDEEGRHLRHEIAEARMPTNFDEAAARRQLESEELRNIGTAQNYTELVNYLQDAINDKRWGRIGAIMRSLAQDYNDNEFTNNLGYTSDSTGMRRFAEEELIKKAGMSEQAALALINDISYINEKTNHWESARLITMKNGKFRWSTEAGHTMDAMAEIRKGDLRAIARNMNRLAYGGERQFLNGDRDFFIKPLGLSIMQTFAPELINQMTFRGGEMNKNALANIYANTDVLDVLKKIPQIWESKFINQDGRVFNWADTVKRYVGRPEEFQQQANLGPVVERAMGKFVNQEVWRQAMRAAFSDNYHKMGRRAA